MRHGHHALVVDLNDAVSHTDATALGNAATQQAANLRNEMDN